MFRAMTLLTFLSAVLSSPAKQTDSVSAASTERYSVSTLAAAAANPTDTHKMLFSVLTKKPKHSTDNRTDRPLSTDISEQLTT